MMWVLPQHLVLSIADSFLQQTAANADQIRELNERVRSMGGILAYPVSDKDSEEKARREALRGYVPLPRRDTDTISLSLIRRSQEVG